MPAPDAYKPVTAVNPFNPTDRPQMRQVLHRIPAALLELTDVFYEKLPGNRASVLQEMLMEICGRDQRYVRDHIDKYHHFIDRLGTTWFGKDRVDEAGVKVKADRHVFAPVNAWEGKDMLGSRNFDKVRDDLLKLKVIEERHTIMGGVKYQAGAYSKGFRLCDPYRRGKFQYCLIMSDTFQNKENERRLARTYTDGSYLARMEDHVRAVRIDVEAALDYMQDELARSYGVDRAKAFSLAEDLHTNRFEPELDAKGYKHASRRWKWMRWRIMTHTGDFPGTFDEFRQKFADPLALDFRREVRNLYTWEMAEQDESTILKIHRGEFNFGRDDFGRLHTTVTNMSERMRRFAWVGSRPASTFVSLDVANSQPFFLAILLLREYGSYDACPRDVKNYIDRAAQGRVYEDVMDRLGIDPSERKAFKPTIFTVFYGRGDYRSAAYEVFGRLWPTVIAYCERVKAEDANHPDKAVRDAAHGKLARKMQGVESEFIIDKVCPQLVQKNIVVLTMHDGLVVPAKVVRVVRRLLLRAFYAEYGRVPQFGVSVFFPSRVKVLRSRRREQEALDAIEEERLAEERAEWEDDVTYEHEDGYYHVMADAKFEDRLNFLLGDDE